ncbi:SRPBCC family protein [Nocardia amamiensis]|uniref:SRPBCC family protein n=1 Tax=Nocardia amamiensis TaxID=404578 RepID=A0ABS0D0P1_9NOCA|nr:SRPBCC family protein [Nocardia amamiensis]MBF6302401.1 SRPBCC family protein [Nocardia amamiensis]
MASTTVDAVIPAPREVVYRLFADRESISPYLPVQIKLTKPGLTEREGVGAQHLIGVGPVGVTEEITELVPGERMEYKVVKGAPVKRHVGIVTFADADNGTLVSYTMESDPKLPVPAKVVELGLKNLIGVFMNGARKAVR